MYFYWCAKIRLGIWSADGGGTEKWNGEASVVFRTDGSKSSPAQHTGMQSAYCACSITVIRKYLKERSKKGPAMTPLKPSRSTTLKSWSEIAAYLRCGIRTAQRWEREEQLPVHRQANAQRGVVFAFAHELRTWLETRDAARGAGSVVTPSTTRSDHDRSVLDLLCRRARERGARIRGTWEPPLKSP